MATSTAASSGGVVMVVVVVVVVIPGDSRHAIERRFNTVTA